ncbi:hypothetical protein COL21_07475 [Bacillus thuringiensis]|nr:hypothetical protein COL21_07475 [Bacillus thuringiensis]PGR96185.1 hypothetical protein COC68_16035 [Bacillus thuringiensis]
MTFGICKNGEMWSIFIKEHILLQNRNMSSVLWEGNNIDYLILQHGIVIYMFADFMLQSVASKWVDPVSQYVQIIKGYTYFLQTLL